MKEEFFEWNEKELFCGPAGYIYEDIFEKEVRPSWEIQEIRGKAEIGINDDPVLIPEMRLRSIFSMPKANEYLQNEFIPNYWKQKNTVIPKSPDSRYNKLSNDIDLDEIFCLKEYRTVKSDHTFSFGGTIYLITSDLKYSIQKQKIEIRTYQNMTEKIFFAGKILEVEELIKPEIKLAA